MAFPYLYQEIDRIYAKTIGKGVRTLSVTSSQPGEGTTSVVCALAQRAKAVNLDVLIVDLNLHNPFVSRMISDEKYQPWSQRLPEKGTSSATDLLPQDNSVVLSEQGEVADGGNADSVDPGLRMQAPDGWNMSIEHQAREIDIQGGPGVRVIPVPKDDDNQVRFREHTMLNQMISYWLEHHDCIIFDTSPLCLVNQKNIPAQHVATCCDAAIVVVKSGQTQVHQLQEAMDILQTVDVNLAGTVMNDYENPLLGVELIRQSQKLKTKLPRLSNWLVNKIRNSSFLFAEF